MFGIVFNFKLVSVFFVIDKLPSKGIDQALIVRKEVAPACDTFIFSSFVYFYAISVRLRRETVKEIFTKYDVAVCVLRNIAVTKFFFSYRGVYNKLFCIPAVCKAFIDRFFAPYDNFTLIPVIVYFIYRFVVYRLDSVIKHTSYILSIL